MEEQLANGKTILVYEGEDIKSKRPCKYRRGYMQGTNDCLNCRYNRIKECGSECVAKEQIKPLSELSGYDEWMRNKENGLIIPYNKSYWLDWLDRNKDCVPKEMAQKIIENIDN